MNASLDHSHHAKLAFPGLRRRHIAFWPALLIFLTVGYFQIENPGRSINRQFAMTCFLSEASSLSVDEFLHKPGLMTHPDDHYRGLVLMDPQPVVALLGVPTYYVYRLLRKSRSAQISYSQARYSTRWLTVGLASAILTALMTLWLLRQGVSPLRSTLASSLVIVATPLMGYSLAYSNDIPACALAFGGYYLLRVSRRGRRGIVRLVAAGFAMGLACWALPAFILPALVLTAWLAWKPAMAFDHPASSSAEGDRPPRLRTLACWLCGLGAVFCGYFVFSRVMFGHWWMSPLAFIDDLHLIQALEASPSGLTLARLKGVFAGLLSARYGLFANFPWVVVMLVGLMAMLWRRRSEAWSDALFAGSVFAAMLILFSLRGIVWEGIGYGPRHLLGVVPFLVVGLVPWLLTRRCMFVWGLLALGLFGALANLIFLAGFSSMPGVVTEEMLANPTGIPDAVRGALWTLAGPEAWTRPIESNWGTALGLRGLSSLWPLAGLWGLFWGWMIFGMKNTLARQTLELYGPERPALREIEQSPAWTGPVLFKDPSEIHEDPHQRKVPGKDG